MHAGYYRAPRQVEETLALVDLGGKAQERAASLSGGQRRRLDVALALIGDPELIFLDEPTTGFDPSARQTAWTVIAGLRTLGKTVFLTTHYMEEAERLADRIAIIAAGKIIAQGTPRTLGERHLTAAQISFTLPNEMAVHDLPLALGARVQNQEGQRIVFSSRIVVSDLHSLSGWALDQGFELEDLQVNRPTLEEVYLNLTQQPRSPR
jgi:ABC-2 type transport system ATP-binding protein